MSVVLIQLPKALYEKPGEEATKELVELINTSVKASKENVLRNKHGPLPNRVSL